MAEQLDLLKAVLAGESAEPVVLSHGGHHDHVRKALKRALEAANAGDHHTAAHWIRHAQKHHESSAPPKIKHAGDMIKQYT